MSKSPERSAQKIDETTNPEQANSENSPYSGSEIVQKLKENLKKGISPRIAFLDIDSTLTGSTVSTNEVRKKLEDLGYAIVFITARTEEMIMSQYQFQVSKALGFARAEPHLGKTTDNKKFYLPPEKVEPEGLIDPDIIAGSSGTKILVKQANDGYLTDSSYEKNYQQGSSEWRKETIAVIEKLQIGKPAEIENPQNYRNAITDVTPPDFRIQIDFKGLAEKQKFFENLSALQKKQIQNMRFIDNSNEQRDKYSIFIIPNKADKARAAEHIVNNICQELNLPRKDLEILIAGDSLADLPMGLYSGLDTQAKFILVGGSRITQALTDNQITEYAGEKLLKFKSHLSGSQGNLEFKIPIFGNRKVIIGDQVFPNTKGPETILKLLEKTA